MHAQYTDQAAICGWPRQILRSVRFRYWKKAQGCDTTPYPAIDAPKFPPSGWHVGYTRLFPGVIESLTFPDVIRLLNKRLELLELR